MRRRSSSSQTARRSAPPARRRGFTLIEALVSILILVIVMVVAMSLLFAMRSFAERQTYATAPRQTARRALNYLTYYLASAGDLNRPAEENSGFSPNALIMYYNRDEATTANPAGVTSQVQASYDNLTGAQVPDFGDEGTDLISFTVPVSPVLLPLSNGIPGNDKRASPLWFRFKKHCSTLGNAGMYAEFERLTGKGTAPYVIPSGTAANPLMMLFDSEGRWVYYKIETYDSATWANCVSPQGENAGAALSGGVLAGYPDPPGGNTLSAFNQAAVQLAAGLQFMTFRVKNATLEQSFGLFDPLAPNAGFTPIVENVEDLQVAYIFDDGTIRNNAASPIGGTPYSGVPAQAGPCNGIVGLATCDGTPTAINCPCPAGALDVTRVVGLRVSVTARSLPFPTVALGQAAMSSAGTGNSIVRWYGQDSENHVHTGPITTPPANPVLYQYHRATTTILLRNRALSEGGPLLP